MMELDQKLIKTHVTAPDREAVITLLANLLTENGYTGSDYLPAVLAREKEYPTGLPSEGVMAAIPHAFSGSVMRTGTAIAVLERPVTFYNMADPDEALQVELVFLMANASGADAHLEALQALMGCLSRPALLMDLKAADTPQRVQEVLEAADSYAEEDDDF